jgi:hypothetical protein
MPRLEFQSTSSEDGLGGFPGHRSRQPLNSLAILRTRPGHVEGASSLENSLSELNRLPVDDRTRLITVVSGSSAGG